MKRILVLIAFSLLMMGCSNLSDDVNNTQTRKYVNEQKLIDDNQIFAVGYTEGMYAYDITDPENLIEMHAGAVVVDLVLGDIKMGVMDETGSDIPLKPIEVVDYEVLSGNLKSDLSLVYMDGGLIDVKSYVDVVGVERVEKFGLNALSETEQKETYLVFDFEYDFDFEQGERYTVILVPDLAGRYVINLSGYGMFTREQNARSASGLKNVITEKELTDKVIELAANS